MYVYASTHVCDKVNKIMRLARQVKPNKNIGLSP